MKKLSAIFVVLALAACSSVPQKLDPDKFYKRDLTICVDNIGCYDGVTVLPRAASYNIVVAPKGDANIDLMLATSCHREESFEKTDSGWFIFKNKHQFKYPYTPVVGVEDAGSCDLMLNTFEKDKGRHAWSRIRFQHPKFQLDATISCNGVTSSFHGVSICQSKTGLIQQLQFPEPVMIMTDPGCPMPHKNAAGTAYELVLAEGQCGYTIRSATDKLHDLVTIGYSEVLVREVN